MHSHILAIQQRLYRKFIFRIITFPVYVDTDKLYLEKKLFKKFSIRLINILGISQSGLIFYVGFNILIFKNFYKILINFIFMQYFYKK